MTRVMTIEAPLAGINRRLGYQNQPPFSCYDSSNFWPIDALTGRAVLASRPVLVPHPTPAGTVNMLARINGTVTGKPQQGMVACAGSDIYWFDGAAWVAATGAQASSAQTGRPLYGAAFLLNMFIPQAAAKPIVFNYTTGVAATIVETQGTAPSGCLMFAVWKGAIWTVANLEPQVLRGSRIGDAFDWNSAVSSSDEGGAFSTAGEQEGLLRGPITALMPHTSDTMLVSTMEGLCALRGHPRQGGIIDEVALNCTVLGQGAWTRTPDGTIYMMTRTGFMSLSTEPGAVPAPISAAKVPAELTGLSYTQSLPTVSVIYDLAYNGIYITSSAVGNPQAWFYDLQTGGFSRMVFNNYPLVLMEYEPITAPLTSGVLWGGAGSSDINEYQGIGQFSSLDFISESFTASTTIGPILIGRDGRNRGKITCARLNAVVEGACTIKIACDADSQGTVHRFEDSAHQWSGSMLNIQTNNGICYPNVAGSAASIQLNQPAGSRVVFEQIILDVVDAGANRHKPYRPPL